MLHDVAFRHQQALDPSALTSITATLHALEAAMTDCRNAGCSGESDPAVVLLARHLADVCADRPADSTLRRACLDAVADIRRRPALVALAYRGVAYDAPAKTLFHQDGRRALRRLADSLCLDPADYAIRSNPGGPAVSGEITLHGDEAWVQLSLGCMGAEREVCFRRVAGRHDHVGERNHWASVRELLEPDRFAVRLTAELRLSAHGCKPERLFAGAVAPDFLPSGRRAGLPTLFDGAAHG